jgi:AcrR family transcriptional regulator
MPDTDQRPPSRRDAQRNRSLLLLHARTVFAEQGAGASLERIARAANLAIGTLYRHFPGRVDLLLAAFESKVNRFLLDSEAALAMPDPWEGFVAFIEALCAAEADDRGFSDFISRRFPSDDRTEALHNQVCRLAESVLLRAQVAGVVRPDATTADLVALLWASSRITEATRDIAPHTWRRHLHLVIDGFRAANRPDLPEAPLTPEQLYLAMARLSQ